MRPLLTIMIAALISVPAFAQLTADDFMPPVMGGTTEVKAPDQVKVEGDTVSAASAQDAMNSAVRLNEKELKGGDTPEVGAKLVKFPSGLGFVASGAASYRTMENATATRIAKRKAYVVAYTQAKKNLAEILGGLSIESKETVRTALTNVNLPKEEMTNISTTSDEALRQATDMMLRGFAVYEVNDDVKQNTVYVSIVTTPKTRGKFARPTPSFVEAADLRDGLNQVIAEVKAGVVPPVGGRIIIMRTTGETAFVGFGSSVMRTSENSAVQAKLNLDSQKVAAMRSKDALCGILIGDQMSWQGSVTESMRDEVKEYEEVQPGDPLTKDNEAGVKKLEKARQTFITKMESTDTYLSARKGILPPGVTTKTWFDVEGGWAYGISVYVPSVSNAAASTAREIEEADLLKSVDDGKTKKPDGSGFTDEKNKNIKKPGDSVKPGPSGKVGGEDEE